MNAISVSSGGGVDIKLYADLTLVVVARLHGAVLSIPTINIALSLIFNTSLSSLLFYRFPHLPRASFFSPAISLHSALDAGDLKQWSTHAAASESLRELFFIASVNNSTNQTSLRVHDRQRCCPLFVVVNISRLIFVTNFLACA